MVPATLIEVSLTLASCFFILATRPLPDYLIDAPAVRMLTRMSDRTLSRRRSDGTIPYVKHGGKIYYSRSRVLEALRNEPNTTSTNKVKKS